MARTGIRATARIPTNRLEALAFGPLTDRTAHICIDMQNVFAEETPWHTPWMARVLPVVTRIAERHPSQTVFTRFIPPPRPDRMPGGWQRYYRALERADFGAERPAADRAGPAFGGARASCRGDRQEGVFAIFRAGIERPFAPAWDREPGYHRSRDRRLRSRRGPRRRRPRLPSRRARDPMRCAVHRTPRMMRC
jgi:hypothetical protein